MKRDYPNVKYDKDDCLKAYKIYKNYVYVSINKVCCGFDINEIKTILKNFGYIEYYDIIYFEPRTFFLGDTTLMSELYYSKVNNSNKVMIHIGLINFDNPYYKQNRININKTIKELFPHKDVYTPLQILNLYDKVYGKGSFDKDFIIEMNKYLHKNKRKIKILVSSQEILNHFHKIVELQR